MMQGYAPYSRGLAVPSPSSSPQPYSYPGISDGGVGRRGAAGGAADSRFAPNAFQYNVRIAIAIVPSVVLLLGAGGKVLLGALFVGLMGCYVLDTLAPKQASFYGVWASILGSGVALFVSGATSIPGLGPVTCALILATGWTLMLLCGLWASVQYHWLQLKHPSVVLAMERFLFAACPLVATAMQTWGVILAVGVASAAYYLLAVLLGLYWVFGLPQPTSFRSKAEKNVGGNIPEGSIIQGHLDSALLAAYVAVMPASFYAAVHHPSHLLSAQGVCDTLLLLFLPVLFLLYASQRGAFWWLGAGQSGLHALRVSVGGLALAVVVACLEIRVVFHSFGHYIHVPAPWNYVLVTVGMYGAAAVVGAHALGLLRSSIGTPVATTVLLVAFLSAAAVIGMPLMVMPAPGIAAVYLAQFLTSRSLPAYFVAAFSGTLCAAWFVLVNFYFLDTSVGGASLQSLCQLLIAAAALALLVPGLALVPRGKHLVGVAVIVQAVLVCSVENRFYNSGHEEEGLYPSYLVVVTSGVGVLACRRLEANGRLSNWGAWLASCLYLAKLGMLLLSTPNVLWSAAALLLALTPPVFLYRGKRGMKPWQALAHAATVVGVVWLCRSTVFDALEWWSGVRPSGGALCGALLLLVAAGCAPIVVFHFPNVQAARRALTLVAVAGALVTALRPPMPRAFLDTWDAGHTPEGESDEEAIYGPRERHAAWPAWLLLAAVLGSVAGASSAVPIGQNAALRLGYSCAMGAVVGVYLCSQHLLHAPALHVPLVAATSAGAVFVVFTQMPSAWSPRTQPLLFGGLVALLPAMLLLENVFGRAHANVVDMEEEQWAEAATQSVLGLYAVGMLLIALLIKLRLSSALRRGKGASNGGTGGGAGGFGGGAGGALPTATARMGAGGRPVPRFRTPSMTQRFTATRIGSDAGWMPGVGNVATLLCFVLALVLNFQMNGGSDKAVFALAPVLLLLNTDQGFYSGFGDRQRYFPLVAATSLYLVLSAAYKIYYEVWQIYGIGYGATVTTPVLVFMGKNIALTLVTIPNHLLFMRFLWDFASRADTLLMSVTPLNLPAVFFADVTSVRVLAALGLAYAVGQFLVSRHVKRAGMRFL